MGFMLNPYRFGAVIGGWKELGRTTLSSVSDDITISGLADKRYYMVLCHLKGSGFISPTWRLNTDTGSNYAFRRSVNGAADITGVSQTEMGSSSGWNVAGNYLGIGYLSNLDTKEKLGIFHHVEQHNAGATSSPERDELTSKHAQTTNPINSITAHNTQSGDYASGSEVVVLGWDPADTHTTNFWEELASADLSGGAASTLSTGTFTNKKYLWVQLFLEMGTTQIPSMRINNVSTGTPYSSRGSNNGAADFTDTSQNQIALANFQTQNTFANYFFVNDGTNEALGICHAMVQNTAGAGNVPSRAERVMKDAGTPTITRLDWGNYSAGSGNYGTKSIVKVWGAN